MKSTAYVQPHWVVLFLSAIISLSACTATTPVPVQDTSEGFAIYRIAAKITAAEILKTPLDTLLLEDRPILSLDDIAAYSQDTHTVALAPSGYEKIKQLKVPTSGIPFVVCVDRQPIYAGAFWASYSSQSFNGTVIDTLLVEPGHSIRIQLGYPESPNLFVGEDRRADPRILQSLQQAGKLRNAPPTVPAETPLRTSPEPAARVAFDATENVNR